MNFRAKTTLKPLLLPDPRNKVHSLLEEQVLSIHCFQHPECLRGKRSVSIVDTNEKDKLSPSAKGEGVHRLESV